MDHHRTESTAELAEQLADVGRAVRDTVRSNATVSDHLVVRHEGGDDVFGIDARADEVLIAELRSRCAQRWPGRLVVEGFAEPVEIGATSGPWTYLADPVDGTRGHLAGTHSAWVLIGAGRDAVSLGDLEVGASVEIPTRRAALGMVARADVTGHFVVTDDDLVGDAESTEVALRPMQGVELDRRFVTVVRLLPGGHGPIGAWADAVLEGLEVYDDLYPCSGGHLMAVAGGSAAAVIDARPLLHPAGFHTHPYDLAAIVVARAAGVIVESVDGSTLEVPIDTDTPVAWAAYANSEIAAVLRHRIAVAGSE